MDQRSPPKLCSKFDLNAQFPIQDMSQSSLEYPQDLKSPVECQRFEIAQKDGSFRDPIATTLGTYHGCTLQNGRFCNDTFVCWWTVSGVASKAQIAGLSSTPSGHLSGSLDSIIEFHDGGLLQYSPCSLCPTSGRFAYTDTSERVTVVDYFSESLPSVRFAPHTHSLNYMALTCQYSRVFRTLKIGCSGQVNYYSSVAWRPIGFSTLIWPTWN
jgi:hypothetical protein